MLGYSSDSLYDGNDVILPTADRAALIKMDLATPTITATTTPGERASTLGIFLDHPRRKK